ncbi:SulP family inorganic anion transporter [Pleomorphovibrio marinus]|uniref:SulP family inorganic anion transporter n=1 Tax=Pleomorphovibrio marinus TaxID=2164132 RepID=UPI000E0CB177|nr:solute carrier family 26 protein [Pleomorphovibrio marinus]
MKLKQAFPILSWLPYYHGGFFKKDLTAGFTVGVMLIPQGMAYAMLAGLNPIHGLYAATLPLLLYAVFGTSRQLAVGPVAMVSLLTAAGIAALNPEDPSQYLLYALTLAFLVGLIQFGMGLFRLGFVVNFISHPVISGFTSAAAIIIGLSQLKHLLGIPLPNTSHIQEVIPALVDNLNQTHLLTLLLGAVGILTIIFTKKINKSLPAPFFAVVFGIFVTFGFGLNELGVGIVGEVPGGFLGFSFPSFELGAWRELFPVALTIALIGFAESFAVARAIQAKHKDYQLDANQELKALGIANVGVSVFNGYPVTGGFSRTAVNHEAGAKTGMASIISAIVVMLTLLFFTEVFYFLPNAILAAVIMVAVYGLIDFNSPRELWKRDKVDFLMLSVTFILTLTLGIETGIIAGMVLSLLAVIYKASMPHMAQLGRVPDTTIFRNVKRFENLELNPGILVVRVDGPLYFANVQYIKDKMDKWIQDRGTKVESIVFDMESLTGLDSTGVHALVDWIKEWRESNILFCIAGARGPIRDIMMKWGVMEVVGKENFYLDDHTAVLVLENKSKEENTSGYALQSNTKN